MARKKKQVQPVIADELPESEVGFWSLQIEAKLVLKVEPTMTLEDIADVAKTELYKLVINNPEIKNEIEVKLGIVKASVDNSVVKALEELMREEVVD